MFDLGFPELITVFVIALVVLGPNKMPGLVATVGRWVGKARSMARQFREQLENEVNLEELNKMTEKRTKEAKAQTPAPPPEFTGAPSADAQPESAQRMADSGYPYGATMEATSAPEAAPAADAGAARTTDDSFSHSHASGDAPMPYEEPVADVPDTGNNKANPAA
jgi:sec-independent protein translocase protein TatB